MPSLEFEPLRRKKIMRALISSLALALLALPPASVAQQYPAKPIKIVVPFAPGGGSDFIARFMAQRLTTGLGQQVIVENKPGAGGMLGIDAGVKSPPDGYTLTLIASSYTVNPTIYKFSFDPVGDITPLIQLSHGPRAHTPAGGHTLNLPQEPRHRHAAHPIRQAARDRRYYRQAHCRAAGRPDRRRVRGARL